MLIERLSKYPSNPPANTQTHTTLGNLIYFPFTRSSGGAVPQRRLIVCPSSCVKYSYSISEVWHATTIGIEKWGTMRDNVEIKSKLYNNQNHNSSRGCHAKRDGWFGGGMIFFVVVGESQWKRKDEWNMYFF